MTKVLEEPPSTKLAITARFGDYFQLMWTMTMKLSLLWPILTFNVTKDINNLTRRASVFSLVEEAVVEVRLFRTSRIYIKWKRQSCLPAGFPLGNEGLRFLSVRPVPALVNM